MNHKITLRYGAAHNSLTLGGEVFDLSTMSKDGKYQVRKNLIEGLKAARYFSREAMKVNRTFRKAA